MSDELLPCVEIEPARAATHAVIWLHGLGADGHDFEPVVPMLRLDRRFPVRFVFPHAPVIPVTLNGGLPMRAWYDIRDLSIDRRADEGGVRSAARRVVTLLGRERDRGVAPERTLLAGFSQGGAVALHVALRHPEPLLGLIALSTYLPTTASLDEAHPASLGMPIFMAHGTLDPIVPHAFGRAARDRLAERGYAVTWADYPMQHQVCAEEIAALGAWMNIRFERSAPAERGG